MASSGRRIKALWVILIITSISILPILWWESTAGVVEYGFSKKARWVDLDSDGLLDVVDETRHNITFYRNAKGGAFEKQFSVTTAGVIYLDLIADLDSDRFLEVVAGELHVGGFILEMDGWNLERTPFAGNTANLQGLPDTLDMEGDGVLELVYNDRLYRRVNGSYTDTGLYQGLHSVSSPLLHGDLDGDRGEELIFGKFRSRISPSDNRDRWPVSVNLYSGIGGNFTPLYSMNATAVQVEIINTSRALIFIDNRSMAAGSMVFLESRVLNETDGLPVSWDRAVNVSSGARIRTGQAIHFNGSYRLDPVTVVDLLPNYRSEESGVIADFNSDGFPDVGFRGYDRSVGPWGHALNLWISQATATGLVYHVSVFSVGVGWAHMFYAVDIDRDGDPDVLTLSFDNDDFSVFLNAKGQFSSLGQFRLFDSLNPNMGVSPDELAFADLDGDGKLDVVSGNYNGRSVSVAPGLGGGKFGIPRVHQIDPSKKYSYDLLFLETVQDLTGDGHPDILYRCGDFILLVNDGRGGFSGLPLAVIILQLFMVLAACAAACWVMGRAASVPTEGLPPSRMLGMHIAALDLAVIRALGVLALLYLLALLLGPMSGPFPFVGIVALIAILALGVSDQLFRKAVSDTGTADDSERKFLRPARSRFAVPLALAIGTVSMSTVGAVVAFGTSWTILALIVWAPLTVIGAAALWAGNWNILMDAYTRVDFKKEWAPVEQRFFPGYSRVEEKFETIRTSPGIWIMVDRATRKRVLTILDIGQDRHFSLVQIEDGRAMPLRPSVLLDITEKEK